MKNLNLTELEEKTLQALIDGLYAEPGFSDVIAKDLSKETGIEMKKIRGVISSLNQKGIVEIEDHKNNSSGHTFIHLDQDFWYLHPDQEWKDWYNHYQNKK